MFETQLIKVLPHVDGGWFWNRYHATPYTGCAYSCAYCYNFETGTTPGLIDDYLEKFEADLRHLPVDVITIGDYQPIEKETRAIRSMLELCARHRFPVHLVERDPLVARDTDLLVKVKERAGWAAVSVSLLAAPDSGTREQDALRALEPDAPPSRERLSAMKTISGAGVLTGSAFMPVVPFLFDSESNIGAVARATRDSGGKYLLFGDFTLPRPFDGLFFSSLEPGFSEEAGKISTLYAPDAELHYRLYLAGIDAAVRKYCREFGLEENIQRPTDFFPEQVRAAKEEAGKLFLRSRDLYLAGHQESEWQETLAAARRLDISPIA